MKINIFFIIDFFLVYCIVFLLFRMIVSSIIRKYFKEVYDFTKDKMFLNIDKNDITFKIIFKSLYRHIFVNVSNKTYKVEEYKKLKLKEVLSNMIFCLPFICLIIVLIVVKK